MEGLVDYTLVEEVTARLKRIKIDGVLESGYIEEMIEDNPASPFPQLKDTERPDTACSALLEGRVVILIDGTPFVLIAPITFFALFQAAEDYYQRFVIGSAIRWLRYLFLGISLQSEHGLVKLVEKAFQEDINARIELALHQVQHEMKADIFDFATEFYREYQQEWKEAKDQWDVIFPKVKVTTDIEAFIRRPGLVTVPGGIPEDEVRHK